MTNSKLLKDIIKDKGVKHKYLARKLGLTPQGFSLKINNYSEWKASEIVKLTYLLNLTQKEQKKIFLTIC